MWNFPVLCSFSSPQSWLYCTVLGLIWPRSSGTWQTQCYRVMYGACNQQMTTRSSKATRNMGLPYSALWSRISRHSVCMLGYVCVDWEPYTYDQMGIYRCTSSSLSHTIWCLKILGYLVYWEGNAVILMKFSSLAYTGSCGQLPEHPVMKISSKWQHFF